MGIYLTGVLPAFFAVLALRTNDFRWKAAVTLSCLAMMALVALGRGLPSLVWIIAAAFVFSILGDFFLSHKEHQPSYYLFGVLSFFVAHVGYLLFTWLHGSPSLLLFVLLLAVYGVYFALRLRPALEQGALAWAMFFYVVISCLSLAAAAGLLFPGVARGWMILGIALILFSDTIIAEVDFVGNKGWGFLILPTYYAAHISILYAVLHMG